MRVIVASIESEYRRYRMLGEGAIAQLTDGQLCEQAPSGGNSVATLVWHISGNFKSRFTDFLTSDGEKPWRDRESEFTRRSVSRSEVFGKWNEGWEILFDALGRLNDADLQREVTIRGRSLGVHEALHRSLAHASFHVGQVVFLAKSLRGSEWDYLTIPPGKTGEYNLNPSHEKGPPPG
jgi:hypothetical protein